MMDACLKMLPQRFYDTMVKTNTKMQENKNYRKLTIMIFLGVDRCMEILTVIGLRNHKASCNIIIQLLIILKESIFLQLDFFKSN